MGVSDLQFDGNSGHAVDLSAQGMQKLDPSFICSQDTQTLILDRNNIMKLDYLDRSPSIQQLSVASNRLVRMMGVCRLTELRVLNLPNNSIGYIEGLRDLLNLKWLNLSGNNIKVIEQLNNCVSLEHLDLSDNSISTIGDLTKLVSLKTLLLHGNSITTLRTVPAHLPTHLTILSLAENEIRDLNEVSYLSSQHELEQLSIMSNPCVMATPLLPMFDYRPYIMSWCLSLKVLDGYVVSQKEGLKAEWLYSQGKGRSYRPGQHVQLVQYLATVCPETASPALETAENAKLEKILNKQRFHQKQLLEESRGEYLSPARPTQLDVERHSPSGDVKRILPPTPAAAPPLTEPVVQFNSWVSGDSSHPSLPVVRSPRLAEEPIYLEDVQTDESKHSSSMLSAESTFLPFTPDIEPQMSHSDSEDETETFEPDSLAPKRPPQTKTNNKNKSHQSPSDEQAEWSVLEEEVSLSISSQEARVSTPLKDLLILDNAKTESKETSGKEDVSVLASEASLKESNNAAVKIQSWWRGQHTRCCHPVAREVRSEIRLRRMQDHIISLTDKLDCVQKQYEEERLQRMVQEEAVKFLWKEIQSMQQWKHSVEQQLAAIAHVSPPPACKAAAAAASPPVASSTKNPPNTDVSFPDSGFPSTGNQQSLLNDSILSSDTVDSIKTVLALSPVHDVDSTDCSLLEQYLSSVQQREEAEESASDPLLTPQPSSPTSPSRKTPNISPPRKAADDSTPSSE